MEPLLVFGALVALAFISARLGHDSRDWLRDHDAGPWHTWRDAISGRHVRSFGFADPAGAGLEVGHRLADLRRTAATERLVARPGVARPLFGRAAFAAGALLVRIGQRLQRYGHRPARQIASC